MHRTHATGDKFVGVVALFEHAGAIDRRGPADRFVKERTE